MTRFAVLIQHWSGIDAVPVAAPPDQARLDLVTQRARAHYCGVANVRAVEHVVIPPYRNEREPTCEDLEAGRVSGGPMGARGRSGRAVGT